jgi:hypothetical protein
MRRFIDLRSLVIGGLLALLILCLMGASPLQNAYTSGRFTMATGPGHAFVLDTVTGQVWAVRAPAEDYAALEWVDGNDERFLHSKL